VANASTAAVAPAVLVASAPTPKRRPTKRSAKKELARLERQIGKLEQREAELHAQLASNATDYEKVSALDSGSCAPFRPSGSGPRRSGWNSTRPRWADHIERDGGHHTTRGCSGAAPGGRSQCCASTTFEKGPPCRTCRSTTPLRPFYRVLVAAAGLYVLVFGAIGTVRTSSAPMFDRSDMVVLGLRTNLAFALASIGAGAVILLAQFVGRNVDFVVNLWGGVLFMAVGLAMMALLQHRIERAEFFHDHRDRVLRDRNRALCGWPVRTIRFRERGRRPRSSPGTAGIKNRTNRAVPGAEGMIEGRQ
jgi:hypothetical protein